MLGLRYVKILIVESQELSCAKWRLVDAIYGVRAPFESGKSVFPDFSTVDYKSLNYFEKKGDFNKRIFDHCFPCCYD